MRRALAGSRPVLAVAVGLLCGLGAGTPASADDIEIYFAGADATDVEPNILFILDTSGSMGSPPSSDPGGPTKMATLKDAMAEVLEDLTDANVGLMRFNRGSSPHGGPVLQPVRDIDAEVGDDGTTRQLLQDTIRGFSAGGNTPIVGTLAEAASYFRGDDVDYGRNRDGENGFISHPDSWVDGEVEEHDCGAGCSYRTLTRNPVYVTPVADRCQTSHVVLLSDGKPTVNNAVGRITSLIPDSCEAGVDFNERCGRELAAWLSESDQLAGLDGDQTVVTHTIAFDLDDEDGRRFLQDLADRAGGSFRSASDAESLTGVFEDILGEIAERDSTFAAPGVAVNRFNRLTHSDELYFALFAPAESTDWPGNLKRYRLAPDPDDPDASTVVDVDGEPAVDPETGFFAEEARSFWSDVVDGNQVGLGGFAGELDTPAARRVFTNVGGDADLTSPGNALAVANSGVTAGLLGVPDDERDDLIRWARGDTDGNAATIERAAIGDPLHSRPVLIGYGADESAPRNIVFFGTNEGFLHAVNTSNGSEVFSFIPEELLDNLARVRDDDALAGHVYGLDGGITRWVENEEGAISAADGDHAFLYAGMRRGGRRYYALDVTRPTEPRLMWTIRGGSGDFAELGQSWAKPILARVDIDGTERTVLVISGGYDPGQDPDDGDDIERHEDEQGRAVYMVDAETGELVWSGGRTGDTFTETFSEMRNSIPADVRVLDVNGDGLADQLWTADTGGQIWRFDVHNGRGVNGLVTGGVIAELAGDDEDDARRFYYPPDVAVIRRGDEQYLSIAIGSGWRAHPLDETVDDRFYALRSPNVFRPPLDEAGDPDYGATITEDELFDATGNIIAEGDEEAREAAAASLRDARGWFIRLERSGEKVLAESVTANNQIAFTTYDPTASDSAGCDASLGTGRVYTVDAFDATPTLDLDVSGDLTLSDREHELRREGIPPEPTIVFTERGLEFLVGPETPPGPSFGPVMRRTYWTEESG